MPPPIIVIGSINMDLVITVLHHPQPGETVLGSEVQYFPGGKGSNQAVGAARSGGSVVMVGAVGQDPFGTSLKSGLDREGILTTGVTQQPSPTGIALITVDAVGENSIVVSPGANQYVTPQHCDCDVILSAGLVMMQLEIPLETVKYVAEVAFTHGIPVLLNPAPFQYLSPQLLQTIHYLVLNETEASQLYQQSVSTPGQALQAARDLHHQGIPVVIITLGGLGVIWVSEGGEGHLPAHNVIVVDTTGAGDQFCGSLATALTANCPLIEALQFANAAAALAVTRSGAQPSLAHRREIEQFLAQV